jgi:mRNA interferase YafQ
MLEPTPTTKFKKDLRKFEHQTTIIQQLNEVLGLLVKKKPLEKKHCDHPLGGNWKGSRECHVNPDILLIYRVDEAQNKLFLERFGSHSALF